MIGEPEIGPKPGPEPERLKLDEGWETAAKRALQKKRPKKGWPKPPRRKGRGK